MHTEAKKHIDYKDNKGRWYYNTGIQPKLVAQSATLCLRGNNGGVADERKVIAKIRTSYYGCNNHGKRRPGFVSDARSNGD